jgi:hypothetical protein
MLNLNYRNGGQKAKDKNEEVKVLEEEGRKGLTVEGGLLGGSKAEWAFS